MFEPVQYDFDDEVGRTLIKVVGVGGGGGNAVNHMVEQMVQQGGEFVGESIYTNDEHGEIIFYAINTDAQALRKSKVQQTVQIGAETTRGLGAGANPNIGQKAAEEDKDAIRSMLEGADMVFIATGMGGGTGTGAAPIVAQVAKELGILTVAVVTKPFSFEGKKRMSFAEQGIKALSQYVDSLIVIPNEKLKKVLPKGASLLDAFAAVNNVLRNAVTGISDMITTPGMVNVDFADVRAVMSEMGRAMMGTGIAQGEKDSGRAEKAANEAVASPLLEDVDLTGARGVIVNILSGLDLTLDEYETIGDTIKSFASDEATVIVGTSLNPEMTDEIRVTIVATGIGANEEPTAQLAPVARSVQGTTANVQSAAENVAQTQSEPTPARPTQLGNNNDLFKPAFLRGNNQ
ncbi:cell division protein FtsZ [Bisgaard Taxon 10/6]|uniref:Cell division protein FtsZ n=1 Tax=Exercitatus varius TaxID=67857 RepID=A0AAW6Q9E1_9PAST|nr:cell division protein FtsZ [Exercitatus varius]MDG2915888.1 cell division protein FtsZ [Exercitatus varius]MDG2918244.1 cell division protein FtsZ [Exercitatus varius]MDG2939454.1 cell division protein FtsZ [Exercitatus varius]MDG2940990.1 cell division protein FtsZ [Exercitatus varius]MDG2944956.1 cell division protein FtsZ [Exercitatus varius]